MAVRKSSPYGEFTLFYAGSPFCNFTKCTFKAKSLNESVNEFCNSEQYFMYNKALMFDNKQIAAQILAEKDPAKIKAYGRQVRGLDRDIWNARSNEIMEEALFAKFTQNPKLREALLETKGSQLVECSPTDQIWGIGLPLESPDALNPSFWRGANRLGKALDKVRDELLREQDIYTVRKSSPYGDFTLFYLGSPFCNFKECSFKAKSVNGAVNEFCNSEKYFIYNKALVFEDKQIAAMILAETNPDIIKGYGRQVRGFNDQIWNSRSNDIMEAALRAKYSQNPKLRQALLDTKGSQLVECSPTDQIWGIGLSVESPDAVIPPNWRGANRLGKALDTIRDELIKEERSR